jgi:hypothetical protein
MVTFVTTFYIPKKLNPSPSARVIFLNDIKIIDVYYDFSYNLNYN